MKTGNAAASDRVWAAIDAEKRRDRFLRRTGFSAWTVTFVFVLVLAAMIGLQVAQLARMARVGAVQWTSVVSAAMPFMIVLTLLSVLIATLTTIGMFVRARAATLNEIQLRLAALEDMLASRPDV